MKRIYFRWALILLLTVTAAVGIWYYSYSNFHPTIQPVGTFVTTDHLEPLNREAALHWHESLPDDFSQNIVLSFSRIGLTIRSANDVAIRRNSDAQYEVICVDGYSDATKTTTSAEIRRVLIRTDLALNLGRLWQLELARAAPVSNLNYTLDSSIYEFSTQTADGKMLFGGADESNNNSCLLPIANMLGSYALSEPENRTEIERELDRLVTAGLARQTHK